MPSELEEEALRRGLITRQDLLRREAVSRGLIQVAEPEVIEPEVQEPTALNPVVAEVASAANRTIAEIPDFFIDAVNTVTDFLNKNPGLGAGLAPAAEDVGTAAAEGLGIPQIPRVRDTLEELTGGAFGQEGFMEPGTARDVAQATGQFLPAVAGLAPGARKVVEPILDATKQALRKPIKRVIRGQMEDEFANVVTGGGIRTGETSAVRKAIDSSGRVITDKAAGSAITQGFSEGVISTIKASTAKGKARMKRMVDILERGFANRLFADRNRPGDVVGDAVKVRINAIASANKRAGAGVKREGKKLAGERADFADSATQLIDDLEEIGVQVGDDLKVSLEGSAIEDIKGAKSTIELLLRRMDAVGDDALKGHRLKKFIDEIVDFGSQPGSKKQLSKSVKDIAKRLRHNIDQALDLKFPAYKKQNDIFRETREVLDAFQDAAGKKLDLTALNVEKQIGTLSRRLMSNVQSRVQLLNSIDGLDKVAAKHGANIDDNILTLAGFADELDTVFGAVAKTSIGGEFAKAATRGKSGIITKALEKGVEAATGI